MGIIMNGGTLNLNEGTVINVVNSSADGCGLYMMSNDPVVNINGAKIVLDAYGDANITYGITGQSDCDYTVNANAGEIVGLGSFRKYGVDGTGGIVTLNVTTDFSFDLGVGG
jgi:hypothetical protein